MKKKKKINSRMAPQTRRELLWERGLLAAVWVAVTVFPLVLTIVYGIKYHRVNEKIDRIEAQYTKGTCNILYCSFSSYQPNSLVQVNSGSRTGIDFGVLSRKNTKINLTLQPLDHLSVLVGFQRWVALETAINWCQWTNQTTCYYLTVNPVQYCSLGLPKIPDNNDEYAAFYLSLMYFGSCFGIGLILWVGLVVLTIRDLRRLSRQPDETYQEFI